MNELFNGLSYLTGGQFFPVSQANKAREHLATLLQTVFAALDVDRRILALCRAEPALTAEDIARRLDILRSEGYTPCHVEH